MKLLPKVLLILHCAILPSVGAAQHLPHAQEVPALQAVPQPYEQVSVQRLGREITRFHFGPTLRRPFLFPVRAGHDQSLTRMGHPHDAVGHSHHNSIWISHHDVGGVNFWGDRGSGKIVYRPLVRDAYGDSDDAATIRARLDWMDEKGSIPVLLQERRQMTARPLDDGDWLLILDLELQPAKGIYGVKLGKTPFGLVGVRMAKTIGVHDGGGTIRNSAGGVNEKEVFWKQAQWVDYSGKIAKDAAGGITLMDHPKNVNHPTHFHVRDDGWMGASLTFAGPRTITKDQPLQLRYGLFVHGDVPEHARIEREFKSFAALPLPDWSEPWR